MMFSISGIVRGNYTMLLVFTHTILIGMCSFLSIFSASCERYITCFCYFCCRDDLFVNVILISVIIIVSLLTLETKDTKTGCQLSPELDQVLQGHLPIISSSSLSS